MRRPKISVIVPVYNAVKYLPRCIESILAQTCRDIELLLIDDGSSDGSGAVCDEYAMRDGRVRVIHKENGGVSAARNDGIGAARGEYLAFCDNDDFCAEGMLERLLWMCTAYDCGIAQCLCERGSADSLPMPLPQDVKVFTSRELLETFYANGTIYIWDKLYRCEVWNEIRFPVGSYTGEDLMIIHHLLWNAGRIAVTREKLYYHYRNPGSVMNRGFDVRWVTGALEDRLDFARREGLTRLYSDTLAKRFYEEGYFLVMNHRCNKDAESRKTFAQEHRRLFRRCYREAMLTGGVSPRDRLFMSMRRFAPPLFHLYNYVKWRIVRGNPNFRWGEYK